MTADKSSQLVPKLRFPEFRDAGKWERKKLGRIGEFVGGGTPNTSVPEYWGGDIQWFTPTEIKVSKPPKSKRTITSEGLNNSSAKLLPTGALLITTRATIGDAGIADCPCATNQGFQSLVVADSEVNIFWYYWLIQHRNELTDRASGSTFLEIGKTELKQIFALRPDKEEQRKIADCLGTLDDLIGAENRKLAALRQHKKGLMQQLFPQPGETVPKLRFQEFREVGEWNYMVLGELGDFSGGGTPRTDNDSFWNGNIPWISSSDISEESIHQINVSRFISQEAVDCSATKIIPERSILLVSRVGVGKLAVSGHPICTSQDFTNFIPRETDALFLAYQLKSRSNSLYKYCQGTAISGFTKDSISLMKLPLPRKAEQLRIADCLGSLDDLIAVEGRKLEALRQHKQGLMQQMFPSPD